MREMRFSYRLDALPTQRRLAELDVRSGISASASSSNRPSTNKSDFSRRREAKRRSHVGVEMKKTKTDEKILWS